MKEIQHATAAERDELAASVEVSSGQTERTLEKYEMPFKLTEDAVLCRVEKENKQTNETETSWVRICSFLDVEAETRDDQGENWGRILVLKDRDDKLHEWPMPMGILAGDGTACLEHLLSLGLTIQPGRWAKNKLLEYISTAKTEQKARCVTRVGWHRTPPGLVYVLPAPGGGIHFRGASSTGKTTALHMAGSVWGGGRIEGFSRSWRATSNGLEAIAAQHNDAMLCLDELSQVDSREAGETAYMLANGSGKNRARRDGSSRASAEWRLFFLSTGEISLADKLNETGLKARAGQEVRLVDIPADAGCGLGIFQNLHGFNSADIFARTLHDNALRYYGTPIRAYLEKLTAKPEHIAEVIARARKDFIGKYVPLNPSGQVLRVAGRFAIIAAAGALATALKILPWAGDEAADAVAECFKSWLEQRGTSGNQEGIIAIRQVRKFFELHGESRFADWDSDTRPTINRAGFRMKNGLEGDFGYFVFPEVFREDICAGLDATFVAMELAARKYLVLDSQGKRQRSVRLPGIGTKRVYNITSAILKGDSDD